MQYIYATRNALLDGSQIIVALTNVCAMPPIVVYERYKDRNVIAFAVLCRQELKIADTNHSNGAGSKVLNSYGALLPLCRITQSGLAQNEHFWGFFHRIPISLIQYEPVIYAIGCA
jgi:hypothetical protein